MGTLSLQSDPTLPQGYLKIDGVTAATLTTAGISGVLYKPATATNGQVLTYNGTSWVAGVVPVSGGVSIDSSSITAGTTSYLLKLADANKVILCNNTLPLTVSVPFDTFSIGTEIILIQRGGPVTLSAGPGVTIESSGNRLKINGISAGVCLIKISSNNWFLGGDTLS